MNYKRGDLVIWKFLYKNYTKIGIVVDITKNVSGDVVVILYRVKKRKLDWFPIATDVEPILKVYNGCKKDKIVQIFKLAMVLSKNERLRKWCKDLKQSIDIKDLADDIRKKIGRI